MSIAEGQRGRGQSSSLSGGTWSERVASNPSPPDNTRIFLSSTLTGPPPQSSARLSRKHWQAARRNSERERIRVSWVKINARTISSRILLVIFRTRAWSNFWFCMLLLLLQILLRIFLQSTYAYVYRHAKNKGAGCVSSLASRYVGPTAQNRRAYRFPRFLLRRSMPYIDRKSVV